MIHFLQQSHEELKDYYLSGSYFDFPKRINRNKGKTIIFFKQTLKDVRNIYMDRARLGMSYDEIKDLCREAWKDEDYNYTYIDRSTDKNEAK